MKLSGGELLLKCLEQEKVKFVFGIVGGQLLTFVDAIQRLGEDADIKYIGARHEEAAANMADAFARITGIPGVCMGTVGPGAANLIPGLYPAYADSIPVLALTAQNQTWKSYPDHGSTQGLDQFALFKGITKWNAVVSHFQRIPEIIQRAFREATSGRPGPVHVDLPVDVLWTQGEVDTKTILPPESYRCLNPPAGNPDAIKKAAQMLVKAEFPLIHAGGGVLQSEASKELVALAEHLAAPVTTSPTARGVVPEDHPLALVTPGYGLLTAQPQADVVLLVGGRLGDYEMWGKPIMWATPEKQKLIQIDISGSIIGLNRPVDIAIIGDAKVTLSLLLKEVKNLTSRRSENPKLEKARDAQRAWLKGFQAALTSNAKPIHTLRVIKEVRDFFPRNAICCLDGGNTSVWALYANRFYEPRTLLAAVDSGHLGVGLPYAIGAKLAKPDTPVYLLAGDGAFMLSIHELETAKRVGANIIAVVINDIQWGMIKGGQKLSFESRFEGVDFTDVRYDQVAKAMGCYGERVESPTEIKPALKRAVDSHLPAVLDVMVNRDIHLVPPDLGLILSIWLEGVKAPKIEAPEKEMEVAERAPAEAEEA
ncbi:MAG: thiamine pyrophosphate-binding protein [Candidatus Atabeyarchaeum deiterrae]